AEEACGGRELSSWEQINGLAEKLARALPLISQDGQWRVRHLWEPSSLPAARYECAICDASARPLGASTAAWQGSHDTPWLKEGTVCEACLEQREPAMLTFLRGLTAPPGANELADALTIHIEAQGGARVVAGEAAAPDDLAGRAGQLLWVNQLLAEG